MIKYICIDSLYEMYIKLFFLIIITLLYIEIFCDYINVSENIPFLLIGCSCILEFGGKRS